MKKFALKTILIEIFYVLSAGLLIFYLMEFTFPGIVLAYFNLNLVLILWLIVGIVLVLMKNKEA